MQDPKTIGTADLVALVQCPPAVERYTPREQASPSALQQYAACASSWGRRYLEGRRETSLTWDYARQIPEPPKPAKGCSALEKATLEAAKKAWNKVRRPALGTEAHAILSAYMVQNAGPGTEGRWHPPMAWREIDWHSDAGRTARPAADVLPDPRTLVAVHTELSAEVLAVPGWYRPEWIDNASEGVRSPQREKPWPRMPGYYDLITVERVARPLSTGGAVHRLLFRLWDFKTTSSFDWAKTEEELREDPQVLLYALHAMQTWGLQEIECSWVYLLTEGKPRAYIVTVLITRSEAESAVLEMAETAAEVVSKVRAFKAGRLRVIDLEINVSACTAYGGCVYHISKGGPCEAQTSPGKALKQKAELDAKIRARKSARKETEQSMALSFAERKAQREAEAAAAKAAGGGEVADPNAIATGTAPAGGEGVAEAGPAPAAGGGSATEAAPAKAKGPAKAATKPAGSPFVGDGAVTATVDGFAFSVPPSSALGKQLAKAAKGLQAAAAAFEGE